MELKEPSPDSSTTSNFNFRTTETSTSNDGSNEASTHNDGQLHLEVPLRHHLDSTSTASQSSPRPSGRGSSSTCSLSIAIGQLSFRDLSDIQEDIEIVKTLHDGSFSKILLAKQDDEVNTGKQNSRNKNSKFLVLKAIPSGGLFTDDFKRELRYNYFLSPHPNIVTSFNIFFNWASCFNVYVQEYAPCGDLSRFINRKCANSSGSASASPSALCLPECQVKLMASQITSALEFMHSFKLVHQDLRAENILVFKSNLSRVKLCDFGCTRKEGTLITKGNLISCFGSSLLPPELCYLLPQERYECHRSSDVWQMGILLCICLTGNLPWLAADFTDAAFRQYTNWLKRKSLKVPESFKKFTPRLVRLLKRLLEPKHRRRSEIREVFKYLSDDWIKPICKVNICPSASTEAFGHKKSLSLKVSRNRKNNNSKILTTVDIKSCGETCNKLENGSMKFTAISKAVPIVDNKLEVANQEEKDNLVKQWIGRWLASTTSVMPPETHAHNDD